MIWIILEVEQDILVLALWPSFVKFHLKLIELETLHCKKWQYFMNKGQ